MDRTGWRFRRGFLFGVGVVFLAPVKSDVVTGGTIMQERRAVIPSPLQAFIALTAGVVAWDGNTCGLPGLTVSF